MIDEVLDHEEAHEVGLGFLDGAVGLAQRLAHRCLFARHLDHLRPQAMRELVRQDVEKEGVKIDVSARRVREQPSGDGHEDGLELRLLDVLEHHPLAALLRHHHLVVGQVEGRRLDAVRRVARVEELIDHGNGRQRPEVAPLVFVGHGQAHLDLAEMPRDHLQPLALRPVAQAEVGLKGGLQPHRLVEIGLVGPDGQVDVAVELHPGDLTRSVVVAQKRLGAGSEKLLERSVVGEFSRAPQMPRRLFELCPIGHAVGHGPQRAALCRLDDAVKAARHGRLIRRERREPGLQTLRRHALGVIGRAARFALRHAVEKRRVAIEL